MSSNSQPVDESLLQRVERHIGRHGGTLNEVVKELFLRGRNYPAGSLLRLLADRERVTIHKGRLPSGRNWTTLTRAALRDYGLPKNRATTSEVALDEAITSLVFCHLSTDKKRRHLLETKEAEAILETSLPNNVSHVLTDEFGTPVILRLFRYTADSPQNAINRLRQYVERASDALSSWVNSGDYGFAVLCPTSAAQHSFRTALRRVRLEDDVRIATYTAPNVEHLNRYLKRRKKS